MELVDVTDSKSVVLFGRVGSSPTSGTTLTFSSPPHHHIFPLDRPLTKLTKVEGRLCKTAPHLARPFR